MQVPTLGRVGRAFRRLMATVDQCGFVSSAAVDSSGSEASRVAIARAQHTVHLANAAVCALTCDAFGSAPNLPKPLRSAFAGQSSDTGTFWGPRLACALILRAVREVRIRQGHAATAAGVANTRHGQLVGMLPLQRVSLFPNARRSASEDGPGSSQEAAPVAVTPMPARHFRLQLCVALMSTLKSATTSLSRCADDPSSIKYSIVSSYS